MVFLHLFNQSSNVALTTPLIFIMEKPLVELMAPFTHLCVPIYLILSGFGLYRSYELKPNGSSLKRLLPLLINFWIILFIFTAIGSIVNPDSYPGSFAKFFGNFSTFNTSYNSEWWFLFPYLVLAAISPLVLRLIKRANSIVVFFVCGAVYFCTSALISTQGGFLYKNLWVYNPLLVFHLLFSFSLGALLAKGDIVDSLVRLIAINNSLYRNISYFIAILLIIAFRSIVSTGIFNPVLALLFVVLFISLKRGIWIDKTLAFLGGHSTNMWLIHSFFCYYLFKDQIYGLKYPILIFIVLVLVSLMSSFVVNLIYRPIVASLFNKRESAKVSA